MKRVRRDTCDPMFPNGLSETLKILPLAFDGDRLGLRYHRTGWARLNYEGNLIKRRLTKAIICTGDQHIGSIEANEFRVATFTTSSEFLDEMDAHTQATYNLAEVICANWDDISDISDYGDIVELSRAWISAPFSKQGCFSAAANALISHLFKGRSLLIIKAFPLEYEGKVTEENRLSFLRRQKAMKRHYQRIFSVYPFPAVDGEDGWMCSVPQRLADIAPPPSGRV